MDAALRALILKRLVLLRELGYRYTDTTLPTHTQSSTHLKFDSLETLQEQVRRCHLCELSKTRTNAVPGKGAVGAKVMFVGEYPGFSEDDAAVPFSGRSNEMLEKMIRHVLGLSPEACYLTYVVKCMPKNTSQKLAHYARRCVGFLHQEIALIRPEAMVFLGEAAYRYVTEDTNAFEKIRGAALEIDGVPAVVTHSLSFLQRNPSFKKETLHDLHVVASLLKR